MKRLLLILIICLSSLSAHAQHFDWVKSYIGESDNNGLTDLNTIVGSAVDNKGNLYILGEFTKGAQIDGTDLLPFTPYGPYNKTVNVVIAKLSPQGHLLWHKAIHSNYQSNAHGIGIQLVGDTSIVCMAVFPRPTEQSQHYTFFLDSLFLETNNFIFSTDSINGSWVHTYLEFDLGGQLKDSYFLSAAGIYADGSFQMVDSTHYRDNLLGCSAFAIDGDGNIIMARPLALGPYSFNDSTFRGYRILINGGERLIDVPVPVFTANTNFQILKFSPRFENLLHQQTIFEPNVHNLQRIYTLINRLLVDEDNSVYILLSLQRSGVSCLDSVDFRITGMPDIHIQTENSLEYSVLLKYDSVLNPQWLFQLDYENNSNNPELYNNYFFNALSIDENGDVYCLGSIWALHQEQIYRADTFNINVRNGIFFARLDKNTGQALAIGEVRSNRTTVPQFVRNIDIATNNNFVIAQLSYQHNIYIRDSVITRPMSTGLFVWDKDGHEVQFIDYNSSSPTNDPRGTILRDNILYLSGRMNGGGTFGNHTLPSGEDRAYVLKYVDAFFATPYVYTDPRLSQSIEWDQDLSFSHADTSIILTANASSGLPVRYVCDDTNMARILGDTLYVIAEGTAIVTAFQDGNQYGYLPATPLQKSLIVGDIGIYETTQIDLKIHPNPTTGTVVINTDGESISNVYLMTSVGQWHIMAVNGNLISLEGFPSGVYYLQVITDKNIYKQKIIKL